MPTPAIFRDEADLRRTLAAVKHVERQFSGEGLVDTPVASPPDAGMPWAVVRITDGTATGGKYYAGVIEAMVPDTADGVIDDLEVDPTWAPVEDVPVWVRDIDGGVLVEDARYLCLLCQLYDTGDSIAMTMKGGGGGGGGAEWSTTVDGILTTEVQTGGGRKIADTGTDGTNGAWWTHGTGNDASILDSSALGPFAPGVNVLLPYVSGSVQSGFTDYRVVICETTPEWVADLVTTAPAVVLAAPSLGTGLSFAYYDTAFSPPTPYQPVVIAGDITASNAAYTSFAVFRDIGGGIFGLKVGLDQTIVFVVSGTTHTLTFRGGLLVSYTAV